MYKYENRVYSQNAEDGITKFILSMIPHKNYFVECGVETGEQCNCRILKEMGWQGLMMDCDGDGANIKKEFVTAENIVSLFQKYHVPFEAGVLSIDIDANDFWVWKALPVDYQFDLAIIEYNSSLGWKESLVMPYQSDYRWDGTDYFGASIAALEKLGRQKGYILIYAERSGNNLFFLNSKHSHLLNGELTIRNIYKTPVYGPRCMGHPHDLLGRKFITY
jgi:hypothetical protein